MDDEMEEDIAPTGLYDESPHCTCDGWGEDGKHWPTCAAIVGGGLDEEA